MYVFDFQGVENLGCQNQAILKGIRDVFKRKGNLDYHYVI